MKSSIRSLNDEYRLFFTDHNHRVKADLEHLENYLVKNGCTFRGEAMPTLLKPNFISLEQSILLQNSVEVMSQALIKVIRAYLDDIRIREIMGFSDKEDELFRIDPGYSACPARPPQYMGGISTPPESFTAASIGGIVESPSTPKAFCGP